VTIRPQVSHCAPASFDWRQERITDTAGCRLTGGSGASCWGYNQNNIVRCGDELYALSWRDDLTLAVFRRARPGVWELGPVLPPVPQSGNLIIDSASRLHVISGDLASWHVRFDEPGSLERWELRRRIQADSRFGAAIDKQDRMLVAGGLDQMAWYILDATAADDPIACGSVPHEQARGYSFVVYQDGAAHTLCSDDFFVAGDHFPNQQIVLPDPTTGATRTVETDHGIYPVLRAYSYYNPDPVATPHDWRCTVVSDVSDTFDRSAGTRGTTDHQDLLVEANGTVHILYFENRQPSAEVWAGTGQDDANARLYHAWGPAGGPFEHVCLGPFTGGRIQQTADGRLHFFLIEGRRSAARAVYYAMGDAAQPQQISEPVKLSGLGPLWHLFISSRRAGATSANVIDTYWTGPLGANSNEAFYGCLTPR
jgi:hypothetical protein